MKKDRFPVSAIVAGIIAFIINAVVIGSVIGGVNVFWRGFALDRQGLLYIGGTHRIDVIREGKKIGEVQTPAINGVMFTIENGDTILIYYGSYCYRMDLKGNELGKTKVDSDQRDKVRGEADYFTAGNGLTYHKSSPWGRTQIAYEQDGKETVVYQMPFPIYLLRICFALNAVIVSYCLVKSLRWCTRNNYTTLSRTGRLKW